MSDALYVRPAEDAGANALARCGETLRDRTTLPTTDLEGPAVTRAAVDQLLDDGVDALLWFGHGERHRLKRDDDSIVDSANVGGVSGVVVAVACLSGRELAHDAVAAGVAAYLGFDDPLGVPLNDPDPTCDAIVDGLDCLVRAGHDVDCAADQMRHHLCQVREACLADAEAANDPGSHLWTKWAWIKSNHLSVVVEGNGSTVI